MLKNACQGEPKPGDKNYESYMNQALNKDFADGAYGLDSFATFPIPPSSYRRNQFGGSYPVWTRKDLIEARDKQVIRKQAEADAALAKERALEEMHGGPAGLKRKREDDANELRLAQLKKANDERIEQMATKMVNVRMAAGGSELPALNDVIPKPQAKTMFNITDTGLHSLHNHVHQSVIQHSLYLFLLFFCL